MTKKEYDNNLKNECIPEIPEISECFIPRRDKRRSKIVTIKFNNIELNQIEHSIPEGQTRSAFIRTKVLGECNA